jgi:hypothetical protein
MADDLNLKIPGRPETLQEQGLVRGTLSPEERAEGAIRADKIPIPEFTSGAGSLSEVIRGGTTVTIDGTRIPASPPTEMFRFNSGKMPVSLVPASYTAYCTAGLAYGALKYAEHNWRRGDKWTKVYESMQRHLDAFREGEDIDAESGLPHLALAGCNLAFLTEFYDKGLGTDDRFRYPNQPADQRLPGRVLEFREPPRRQQAAHGSGAGTGDDRPDPASAG